MDGLLMYQAFIRVMAITMPDRHVLDRRVDDRTCRRLSMAEVVDGVRMAMDMIRTGTAAISRDHPLRPDRLLIHHMLLAADTHRMVRVVVVLQLHPADTKHMGTGTRVTGMDMGMDMVPAAAGPVTRVMMQVSPDFFARSEIVFFSRSSVLFCVLIMMIRCS
jgi:hypothetical protein